MSADDEEHSESEFYYSTEDITLPIAFIETTFYLGEYEFMRGDLKKIKILFTGMVGPYREIFLSVRTSNPVNNIYIFLRLVHLTRTVTDNCPI